MYPNLKLQIFKSGIHQNYLAKQLGFSDTALSKIIHGYLKPSEEQKKQLASYFGVETDWLFETFDVRAEWHKAGPGGNRVRF